MKDLRRLACASQRKCTEGLAKRVDLGFNLRLLATPFGQGFIRLILVA